MSTAIQMTHSPESTAYTARDIFGKVIAERDMVVYATRRGSETFLKKLSVTSVNASGIRGFDPEDVNRRTRLVVNLRTVAKVS